MESAIPEHLRTLRSCPSAMPEKHEPPFPAWTARFSPLSGRIVMAYFGIQGRNCPDISSLNEVTARFSSADGPGHWNIASCKDHAGFYNLIAIAYWSSAEQFESWKQSSLFHLWWSSPERENGEWGFFLEIVSPRPENFETIFSDRTSPEGASWLAEGMSGEMREHGYWGSARDRLPAAQNNPLYGTGKSRSRAESGKRIVLSGSNNLCLIRSGQDWSATQQEERQKYLTEVEPVLRQGMDFLRDQGHTIGCLSCRYMQVLEPLSHALTEKTFGLARLRCVFYQRKSQLVGVVLNCAIIVVDHDGHITHASFLRSHFCSIRFQTQPSWNNFLTQFNATNCTDETRIITSASGTQRVGHLS